MPIHQFVPAAADLELCAGIGLDGKTCFGIASDGIHQRTQPRYFMGAKISVSVSDPSFMVHVATVHWTMEDGGSWWAAWVEPHNRPGTYRRITALDSWKLNEVTTTISKLATGFYDMPELTNLGITNL